MVKYSDTKLNILGNTLGTINKLFIVFISIWPNFTKNLHKSIRKLNKEIAKMMKIVVVLVMIRRIVIEIEKSKENQNLTMLGAHTWYNEFQVVCTPTSQTDVVRDIIKNVIYVIRKQ